MRLKPLVVRRKLWKPNKIKTKTNLKSLKLLTPFHDLIFKPTAIKVIDFFV